MAAVEPPPIPRFTGLTTLKISAAVGLVGLALTLIGILADPDRALLGYLFAYVTVAVVVVGALILLLIGYVANARWIAPLRRMQEGIVIALPALAVLFVPIALGLDRIYVWAMPASEQSESLRHVLHAKAAWLNESAFLVRSILYLAVFIIAAEVLRRWSRRRDSIVPGPDGEVELRRERVFASAMLAPVGLALTFAAFDWLMSLQPEWMSSMFGVYVFAGGFGGGIALLAILTHKLREHPNTPYVTQFVTGNHFHALGRLLLAFVVFWTYANYFQGFLIQIANRPNEVTFFVVRTRWGWEVVLWAVLLTHFVLPFLLLLPRRLKLRRGYVPAVGALVLVGHVLDMFWLVIPSTGEALNLHWVDLCALLGIGGTCIALATLRQRDVPIVSAGDPFLVRGSNYESPT